jgi:hypothetical protein
MFVAVHVVDTSIFAGVEARVRDESLATLGVAHRLTVPESFGVGGMIGLSDALGHQVTVDLCRFQLSDVKVQAQQRRRMRRYRAEWRVCCGCGRAG